MGENAVFFNVHIVIHYPFSKTQDLPSSVASKLRSKSPWGATVNPPGVSRDVFNLKETAIYNICQISHAFFHGFNIKSHCIPFDDLFVNLSLW